MIPLVALGIAAVFMLIELSVSRRHEQRLLAGGAVAPSDPAYSTMRWAYPGVFAAMAAEGVWSGPVGSTALYAGVTVFVVAKLLKGWAIAALGDRWTFRVLVLPNAPLVAAGPYRWIRHPNYLAVIGELAGFALVTRARLTGIVAILFFGELLRRRIQSEERALGLNR